MSAEQRYEAFDLLATMVAVARPDGTVLFANAGFETCSACRARALVRTSLFDWFADPAALRDTVWRWRATRSATGRLEATLRRGGPPATTPKSCRCT